MKFIAVFALLLAGCSTAADPVYRVTCYKSGENVDGLSKTCFYRCTCGTKALNIQSHELCPVNADFNC